MYWFYLFLTLVFLSVFLLYVYRAGLNANGADWGSRLLNAMDGINRLFCRKYHRLNESNLSLPESGAAIVVSNHISGLDPMLLLASSPRPLRFLIAREQYERFGFTWLFKSVGCIPIDRRKHADNSMRMAIKALKSGEVLAIFPHGKIHLPTDSPARLKQGAARLAIKAKCPIVPVNLSGVAAQGHVLTPVIFRAHAFLKNGEAFHVSGMEPEAINKKIEALISE